MTPAIDIDRALRVEELRRGFLEYTRRAFHTLPAMTRPRVLDIGCGSGQTTLTLAELSGGEVVGIDIDDDALAQLRDRAQRAQLTERVTAVHSSLFETGFADECFDLLWEEGVLHLLDSPSCLQECYRLMKPGGFLVSHEQLTWFEQVREQLPSLGFRLEHEQPLPERIWWTSYGAPLERRILALRETHGEAVESAALARHEQAVASIKRAPDQLDCGFFIIHKPS